MGFRFVAVLLIASVCAAQTPTSVSPNGPPATPAGQPAPLPGTITVPQGTSIALTLVNPIKSKSTKPGDTVRGVVAFPVTVGTQLAVPAGAYVEGMVNTVTPRPGHGRMPSVRIHFTRLLYANGYSVALDAINSEATVILPDVGSQPAYEIADARGGAPYLGEGFAAGGGQTPPPLPSLPQVGPSKALVIGLSVGGTAAVLLLGIAVGRHHLNSDYVLFDNGWQFQMVLQQPLALDAVQVAAAVHTPAQR